MPAKMCPMCGSALDARHKHVKDIGTHAAYSVNAGVALDMMPRGTVKLNRSAMSATCIFTTSSVDRVGDSIHVPGIRTANHQANPVVLWDHGKHLTLPIGKTRDPYGGYTVVLGPDEGAQETYFSQTLPEAEQIYALIDEGIISANSIGFKPIKASPLYLGGRRAGLDIQECELLEISWVGVPCNQDAVRAALDRDKIAGKSLAPMIRAALEPIAAGRAIWSPGATLDAIEDAIIKSGTYNENDHSRGQPGNAGQFGPGGASSGGDASDDDDETDDEPEEEEQDEADDDAEDLADKWADETVTIDEINQTETITPEKVAAWNAELETVGSEVRLYANPDGDTVAGLLPEEMAVVSGLKSQTPAAILAANAELEALGDYRLSLWSDSDKPQLYDVNTDPDDPALTTHLPDIAKAIKSRADMDAVNAALDAAGDSERLFYDGIEVKATDEFNPEAIDTANAYTVSKDHGIDATIAVNDKLQREGNMCLVPLSTYYVKAVSNAGLAEVLDTPIGGPSYAFLSQIQAAPESERAGLVDRLNGFYEDNGADTRFFADGDSYTPMNTLLFNDGEAAAEEIADNWGIDEDTEARIEWWNNLVEENGGDALLQVVIGDDGEKLIEVASGTGKGLRFWSTKNAPLRLQSSLRI